MQNKTLKLHDPVNYLNLIDLNLVDLDKLPAISRGCSTIYYMAHCEITCEITGPRLMYSRDTLE